jgi:hypothetical protein
MIDYDGFRLCLRTAATNGPIVHPPGDMLIWRAMVIMMLGITPDSCTGAVWQSYQQRHLERVGGMEESSENFAYSVPLIRQRILNMP